MIEEKSYREQIKDCILTVCESDKYDVSKDEFDVEVLFDMKSRLVSNRIFTKVCELNYEIRLTEKKGNFIFSIISSIDPKYVAVCAVMGYIKTREEYIENKKSEEKKPLKKQQPLFRRIFY